MIRETLLLASYRLRGRSLFLEAGDTDAVASGPFLIPLDADDQINAVVSLAGQCRPPVIWSWPDGEQALYRHLRKNNLVEIPHEPELDDPSDEDYEAVIFRHWEPYVLALMLPVMTQLQQARFLGAATGIAFDEHAVDGIRLSPFEGNLLPQGGRMLRFDASQSRVIETRVKGRYLGRYPRPAGSYPIK